MVKIYADPTEQRSKDQDRSNHQCTPPMAGIARAGRELPQNVPQLRAPPTPPPAQSRTAACIAPWGCPCICIPVSYTHLRAHETDSYLVCRLLLEKKKTKKKQIP